MKKVFIISSALAAAASGWAIYQGGDVKAAVGVGSGVLYLCLIFSFFGMTIHRIHFNRIKKNDSQKPKSS